MDQTPQELQSKETEIEASQDQTNLLAQFLKKFESIESQEEKLRSAIDFMRASLARTGAPFFKGFWEVRKISLPLFKEGLSSTLRATLWDEYVELTREGRRLKNVSDEESAFAVEQIEIAIKSLESEVDGFHHYAAEVLAKTQDIELPHSKTLQSQKNYFQSTQRRLNLLNTYASHIHALRKELIKTEMRVRNKNKFFERLSLMGDRIFPSRKELIQEVSNTFSGAVDQFIEENFSEKNFSAENLRRNVFFFRDEIKALQATAKIVTLNTVVFTKTRQDLSKCWDQLKGMEKERKQEVAFVKQKSGENAALILSKIQEIVSSFKEGKTASDHTLSALDGLSKEMRDVELMYHDVKMLKEQIKEARALPEAKKIEEESAKKRQETELEEKRKEILEEFKLRLNQTKDALSKTAVEVLSQEFAKLKEDFANLCAPKRDKQFLERQIKELRDNIEDKRQEALLNLSDESKAVLDHLKEIFEERKKRRAEMKAQIEEYRCLIGGSSLDFEKAIEYGELMKNAKERLEKMDESIQEIEEKIRLVKKKT